MMHKECNDLHDAADEQDGEGVGVARRELAPLHELQHHRVTCHISEQPLSTAICRLRDHAL